MPVQFGRFHIDLRTTCDHGRLSLCVNWMQYAFDYLVGLLHLPGAVQMWVVHNATMRIEQEVRTRSHSVFPALRRMD